MSRSAPSRTFRAIQDLAEGVAYWRLWMLLAWSEIKQRYRRSTLGPLWLTLSTAVQMFVMGMLISFLFQSDFAKALPYVCAGLIFWGFLQGILTDGSMAFLAAASYMMQVKRPLSLYLLQTIWRNIIILAHNFVIFVVIAAIYQVVPTGPGVLLWILGFALDVVCTSSLALLAAIISVRFRDFPMILQSVFSVLFWVTPLMYFPEQLGTRQYLVDYNPFTHLLALVREPLLGQEATAANWLWVAAMAVAGWVLAIAVFARYRSRIVYWL